MARAHAGAILRHIYPLVEAHRDSSDAQLLQRFTDHREEEAFAALMRRHGRLVWSVCRHILRNEHDAEDAFQATFLVLARRAPAIRKGESIGSWLHGVAYRTAVRAKRAAARREQQERYAVAAGTLPPDRGPTSASVDLAVRELQAMLDEEVALLPVKYRAPFVLCCLEGRSRAEAAVELGWKEGTVSSRIAQARQLLEQRLARRGVTLSAALTAGALTGGTASAALVQTTRAAALLVAAGRGVADVASPSVAALVARGTPALAGTRALIAVVLLLAAGLGGVSGLIRPRDSTAGSAPPARAGEPKADRLGDPLPPGVLMRIASGRMRHTDRLRAMAISPDGRVLATGGGNRLRIWDTATGKLKRQFKVDSNWAHRIAFSADSSILVSADGYHDVACHRLDLRTGKELSRFHVKWAGDTDLSANGALLAVITADQTARLFDTATGWKTAEVKIAAPGKDVRVAVRPDGKALAVTNTKDRSIRVYDVATGQMRLHLEGPVAPFTPIRFSPDGHFLAANSGEARDAIRLWDLASGKERLRLNGSRAYHSEISYSADGKLLAAAGPEAADGAVWDLTTGKQVHRFSTGAPPRRALFAPDGKTVFTEALDGAILVWDVESGKSLPVSANPVTAVRDLRFDGSGKRLVGRADVFRVWDSLTGREVREYPPLMGRGALSPDETLLAGSTDDGTIRLLDAATGKEIRVWKAHDRALWTLAFSVDGKRLFSTGGWDPRIRVWDVTTGRCVIELLGDREGVVELAVSPDGRFLASCGNPSANACDLRLWDLATGLELRRLPVHQQMRHYPVFSPDSRWLAAATRRRGVAYTDGEVNVWEVATGRLLGIFAGHKEAATAIAFSADSRTLATVAYDRSVRLWDLGSRNERQRLLGHNGPVLSLAFAPDNRRLAASSPDAPIYIWDVATATRRDPPQGALTAARREALWQELGEDPARAYPAVIALAAVPTEALALLDKNLHPVPPAAADRVGKLLADLDSDHRAVREKASAELERLGESVVAALRDALARKPSPEVTRRVKALLNKATAVELSSELLRGLRAIAVLEQIGSPEAKRALRKLAGGAREARLTGEAKLALERLERRLLRGAMESRKRPGLPG